MPNIHRKTALSWTVACLLAGWFSMPESRATAQGAPQVAMTLDLSSYPGGVGINLNFGSAPSGAPVHVEVMHGTVVEKTWTVGPNDPGALSGLYYGETCASTGIHTVILIEPDGSSIAAPFSVPYNLCAARYSAQVGDRRQDLYVGRAAYLSIDDNVPGAGGRAKVCWATAGASKCSLLRDPPELFTMRTPRRAGQVYYVVVKSSTGPSAQHWRFVAGSAAQGRKAFPPHRTYPPSPPNPPSPTGVCVYNMGAKACG